MFLKRVLIRGAVVTKAFRVRNLMPLQSVVFVRQFSTVNTGTTQSLDKDIVEVNKVEEWQSKVMEQKVPVIVDCYADWCGPCKKLTPVLEQLTRQHEGKFKLVKVNIDKQQQIAQGLNVKSIPALFLVYKGNVLDTMTGFDPQKLEKFVETALLVDKAANDETVVIKVIKQAQQFIEQGNYAQAMQMLQDTWGYEQWREQFGPQLVVGMAYCELKITQNPEKAKKSIGEVTALTQIINEPYWTDILSKINAEIEKLDLQSKPDETEYALLERISNDPTNLDIKFELAGHLITKGRSENAITVLLAIIQQDKKDKRAQVQLMDIFAKLGSTNDAVKKGRKKLASILL